MTGKTHMWAGVVSGFLLLLFFPEITIFHLIMSFIGGIFPDMDASESTIKHLRIPLTRRVKFKPFFVPATIIALFLKHRGSLHSIFGMIITSGIIGIIFWIFWVHGIFSLLLAFIFWFFSHLLLDGCTKSGVPFFYPWKKKNFHTIPKKYTICTGDSIEYVLEFFFLLSFLGLTFVFLDSGNLLF